MKLGFVRFLIVGATALCCTPRATASLVMFSDRTTFRASAPGLPLEDFEAPLIGAFQGSLNSTTDNVLYAPGDILAGVSFSSPGLIGLQTLAPFMGLPTVVLATYNAGATLFIDFSPTSAVGFTLFGPFHQLPGTSVTVNVNVFDAGGLIGTSQYTVDRFGSFVGFISPTSPITQITLTPNLGSDLVGLDDIEFGSVPEPGCASVVCIGLAVLALRIRRTEYRRRAERN